MRSLASRIGFRPLFTIGCTVALILGVTVNVLCASIVVLATCWISFRHCSKHDPKEPLFKSDRVST